MTIGPPCTNNMVKALNVEFGAITQDNVEQVRCLNQRRLTEVPLWISHAVLHMVYS